MYYLFYAKEDKAYAMENVFVEAYGDCESSSDEEDSINRNNKEITPLSVSDGRMATADVRSGRVYKETCSEIGLSRRREPQSHRMWDSALENTKKRPLTLPTNANAKPEESQVKQRRLHISQADMDHPGVTKITDNKNNTSTDDYIAKSEISRTPAAKTTRNIPKDLFVPPQVFTRRPNVPTEDLGAYGLNKSEKGS